MNSQVVVLALVLACRCSVDELISILLVARSLVVLLLILELVKLAHGCGVGLWLVISWLELSFVLLGLEDFG